MTSILIHYIVFASFILCFSSGLEPITTITGVVGGLALSAAYAGWEFTKCFRQECCSDKYLKLNFSGLENAFRNSLHGQHLAEHIVARAVRGHVNNKNPKKALVMAFHGRTGSGKNFVSNMLAEHLYTEGMKSHFVHLYLATHHFPHARNVDQYKEQLQQEVTTYAKECGRSLFIFDELDKMPSGLVDVLKPYIDYHEEVDGIDYRKNIFIFLSNAGGKEISKVSLDFWLRGKERQEIQMKDIEPLINKGAFNELGGLQHSAIIKNNLIDFYVPFFPLEKSHVKLCIQDEIRSRFKPVDMDIVDKIAGQLEYFPKGLQLYSSSGCKKVSQKVDIYVD